MSNTRIPSPARSLGALRTPRRYIKRRPRSVGSPARSNASGRLTSIINMNALSPLPSRRSVLTDTTYIQEPRRKSWWREIDENSGYVLDVLESVTAGNTNNAIEELIEMEVLSQEKRNPLDLPESSDSESINSIILPQRILFSQKEVQHKKQFIQLIGNRESLAKLNKNNCGDDKTIVAGTKNLFQNNKPRSKPIFPAALLSITPNKTTDEIFKETNALPPKTQVRNIFNGHPPTKRKNMFAEFVITESDDEMTEIHPKIFEFQNNKAISQPLKNRFTASSDTTNDTEMDDWIHLPSSTMVDKQIEEQITPKKKTRISRVSEAKESEVGTNSYVTVDKTKQSNKSLKNLSLNSSKNIDSSFKNTQTLSKKNNSNTSIHIESNESLKGLRKKGNMSQSQSHNMSIKTKTSKDKTIQAYKGNETIQEIATELSNKTTNTKNMETENKPAVIAYNKNQSKYVQPEDECEDNNFTLEYDNDDENSSAISDKLIEVNNMSKIRNPISSQLDVLEYEANSNNIDNVEENKQEPIDNEKCPIQNEQGEQNQKITAYNSVNNNDAQNGIAPKQDECQTQNKCIEDQIISDYDLINSEKAKNGSAQEDNEVEKTLIDDAVTSEEKEQNKDNGNIENSLQVQNKTDKIGVGEYTHEDDDIAQELDVDECDVQDNQPVDELEVHEEKTNESSENENQYSDEDQEVEQEAEDDSEVDKEESEDGNSEIESSNDDAKSPEVILYDKTNQMDSLIGRHSSARKTKSLMLKSPHIAHSMATVQDVTRFSDGTKNSSTENSCWDSHRTTRKTIRQTLGKGYSPRKSLRTLVMEKSMKRLTTAQMEMQWDTAKFPQANSTEFPETSNQDFNSVEDPVEQSEHEISKRTRQATLETYLQKITQKNMERRLKTEEAVRHSLKRSSNDNNLFKVPKTPIFRNKRPIKPVQNNSRSKQKKSLIPLDGLPPEVLKDLKYKPPKRFKPSNASWITTHLYKFIENKLQAKYDYKARVRAEKLVETLYDFTKNVKRHEVAPTACVQVLKQEMARLNIVKTHFEFYNFFHQFMPREIRIKVVPDIVNKIPLPKHGIFSNIIRD